MILRVQWRTVYRYSRPVRLLHTELHVMPGNRARQRVLSGGVTLDPPARLITLVDAFGNTKHHVDFLIEIARLEAGVDAEVETAGGPEPALRTTPLAEWLYRQPTPRAPFAAEIDGLFGAALPAHPLEAAAAVMETIVDRFTFEVGWTDVTHTALDVLRTGGGVCQDFAHLMLAALRRRGIAARYVSGYLAPASGEALATASHAWVQILDGDAWHGFDPANNTRQDERYVVTAVGRDYDDVPPLRGTYLGEGVEQWSTEIRIGAGDG